MSETYELLSARRETNDRVLALQKKLRLAQTDAKKEEILKEIKEAKSRLSDLDEEIRKLGL